MKISNSKVTEKNCNHIMIFDLSVGGHYPEYIAHMIDYWCKQNLEGQLDIVVSPQFLNRHYDVAQLVEKQNSYQARFISITLKEFSKLKPFNTTISRNIRAWQEFKLATKYALNLKANHIFFSYFDTRQIPIILRQRLPCAYSGIYFRPSFHYKYFVDHKLSWGDKIQQRREYFSLSNVLSDPNLKTLFCLDPFAIQHINKINNKKKAVFLPDPVTMYSKSLTNLEQLKSTLEINSNRQVHILFGALGKRKGLDKLLKAIALLPVHLCEKLCLLLVGSIEKKYYQECLRTIEQITNTLPVQIIVKNKYIPETEIQNYFEIANVVLAPYQHHVGMSGILNRAAVAQKPVLSSNYGLMREITHRYKLGLTVDSTKASAIAEGLTTFLTESPNQYRDRALMKQFAEQNTPQKFASTIFENILS